MNNQKTYSEKLRDPRWQKKRLEILQRDEFTCQLCNDRESTLHVHHKEYMSGHEPWDYDADNFMTLCEVCHGFTEFFKGIELLKVYKRIHPEDDKLPVLFSFVSDNHPAVALCSYERSNNSIEFITVFTSNTVLKINELFELAENKAIKHSYGENSNN